MMTSAAAPTARVPAPAHPIGQAVVVALIAMTADDLEAFIAEEVTDYADERVGEGDWQRRGSLERAREVLSRVIAWERDAATTPGQRLYTAIRADGIRIGWMWVKLAPPGLEPPRAFLCQMTVGRAHRHRGYGRAMLATLERLLAAEGIVELRLNVCESNWPAKCLYETAGYEPAAQYATMRLLRKRLAQPLTGL